MGAMASAWQRSQLVTMAGPNRLADVPVEAQARQVTAVSTNGRDLRATHPRANPGLKDAAQPET